jgi:hypothetical protein
MADHLHKQIREAAATALTGLTTSGARVYQNRLHPFDSTSLPGLRISLAGDSVTPETIHHPHIQSHQLALVVECVAAAVADLDDKCDLMSKEVEIALASGITVAGRTLRPTLAGSRYDEEAGGTPAGSKRLNFTVDYECLNTTPDTLS